MSADNLDLLKSTIEDAERRQAACHDLLAWMQKHGDLAKELLDQMYPEAAAQDAADMSRVDTLLAIIELPVALSTVAEITGVSARRAGTHLRNTGYYVVAGRVTQGEGDEKATDTRGSSA